MAKYTKNTDLSTITEEEPIFKMCVPRKTAKKEISVRGQQPEEMPLKKAVCGYEEGQLLEEMHNRAAFYEFEEDQVEEINEAPLLENEEDEDEYYRPLLTPIEEVPEEYLSDSVTSTEEDSNLSYFTSRGTISGEEEVPEPAQAGNAVGIIRKWFGCCFPVQESRNDSRNAITMEVYGPHY